MTFHKIKATSRLGKTITVEGDANLLATLKRAGEKARMTSDGVVISIDDPTILTKCAETVFKAVLVARDGAVSLCDNPNAVRHVSMLKRDSRPPTAGSIHASLRPHASGPMNPGPLAKGVGTTSPRYQTEADKLEKAATARASQTLRQIHRLGSSGNSQRNEAIRRAVAKAAQSEHRTSAGAKRQLRKNLLAEGFSIDELEGFGLA